MNIALLVLVCLAGHQDDCRAIMLSDGFADGAKCEAAAPLMVAGLFALQPTLEIKKGTRPICTASPQYLLNRFKA